MSENFIDLLPELEAQAAKNKGASPHQIAREFVLEEGRSRGGMEIIVAIDRLGCFIAACTHNKVNEVHFPPTISGLLQQPSANLTIHHNHPVKEPCFSKQDMRGLSENCGMGWLLMHLETGYSAMRASDWLFTPDGSAYPPARGLVAAYQNGQMAAKYEIDEIGTDDDVREAIASELALQALHQANSIEHYSSLKTGLSREKEQYIIRRIRDECAVKDTEKFGKSIMWSGLARPALPPVSGGEPASDRQASVSYPSTLETGFERFLSILSRQNASIDSGKPGRAPPSKFSEPDKGGSGLASGSANARSKIPKPRPG